MPFSKAPGTGQEELLEGLPEEVNLVDLIDKPAWKTILIELVKTERMDPWAIDVSELALKYLEKIQLLEKADLRIPANAILASAILLKMKARTIKIRSLKEMEDEWENERVLAEQQMLFSDENIPDLYSERMSREGGMSLDELVQNIQEILEKTKHKEGRKLSEITIPEFNIPFLDKDIEQRTEDIYERIKLRADSQGIVMFSSLLNEKTPLEMATVFIPLLFLFNKDKITMWQEQFWQEIFISLNGKSIE